MNWGWVCAVGMVAFALGALVMMVMFMSLEKGSLLPFPLRQHRSELPQIPQVLTGAPNSATGQDYTGALAVPDTTGWWLAIHQVIDREERSMIESAQGYGGVANERALNALANSEGANVIRQALIKAREEALVRQR